ncbi:hypothetical protein GCM10022254_06330 [Actinomadura meridiana]|uniref:Carrier domain-containing protein n=1 Tax=Actinomadura meridiana TaxID=559626 RepID=A0ABP8BT29_9ACTN
METIPKFLEDLIHAHCRVPDGSEIRPEVSLMELGMDSVAMMALVADLEDMLDFPMPYDLLTTEVFATPRSLWTALGSVIPDREIGVERA